MKYESPFLDIAGTGSQLAPTRATNVKISSKRNVLIGISTLFLFLELFVYFSIFLFLYHQRITVEFNKPFSWLNPHNPRFLHYAVFYSVSTLLFAFFVYRSQIYRFRNSLGLSDELLKVCSAASLSILMTIGISFLLKYNDFSRLVVLIYWLSSMLASVLLRFAKRRLFYALAENGSISRNILIIGAGKVGKSVMEELSRQRWLGYRLIGFVDDQKQETYQDVPYLGTIQQTAQLIHDNHIEEILITIPSERKLVSQLINELRKLSIRINIVPDMFNLVTSSVQVGSIHALPVVTLVKTPMRGMGLVIKRLFDILGSVCLILLSSPVLLLTTLWIKLDSTGPVFYYQPRIGKDGKMFRMFKFRSMVQNAEQFITELADKNEIEGWAFKIKDDPRVTRAGRFIRKYSIDELPQLINVLKGDMSLVGPRPPLPYEVDCYGDWEWRRLEVMPGITGLWQVSGRSHLSFQQWVNLDIYYIENWNLLLDLKIILKTIPVVIKGEGAY